MGVVYLKGCTSELSVNGIQIVGDLSVNLFRKILQILTVTVPLLMDRMLDIHLEHEQQGIR